MKKFFVLTFVIHLNLKNICSIIKLKKIYKVIITYNISLNYKKALQSMKEEQSFNHNLFYRVK